MVQTIQKRLTDAQISFSDICEFDDGEITINIEWGDWKHDHLYCDHIMKEIGYELVSENETDQDGSDCYSSAHNYERKTK